jgi:hypothetical protein
LSSISNTAAALIESVPTAIALVTVLLGRGIYYGQVYLIWSSEDDLLRLYLAFSPYLERAAKENGNELLG